MRRIIQALLAERFGLRTHHEAKEVAGYELTIAKGGPKLKIADPEPTKAAPPPGPNGFYASTDGAEGYPVIPRGVAGAWIKNVRGRAQWFGITMAKSSATLSSNTGLPVQDRTALSSKYNVALYWATNRNAGADDDLLGPNLAAAVQQ